MVVQHNLTAMNSNRMLGLTTASQAKSTEKLSSGYKINRAADDAAGLSISEKMRKQIRGLTQASSNAQDGISAVQTAEGALNEVQDMLQRMNELAVKSSNGTNSEDDRQYIQDEIDQLTTEIDRVSTTTKFNETYLLQGNAKGTVTAADAKAENVGGINGLTLKAAKGAELTAGTVTVGKVEASISGATKATASLDELSDDLLTALNGKDDGSIAIAKAAGKDTWTINGTGEYTAEALKKMGLNVTAAKADAASVTIAKKFTATNAKELQTGLSIEGVAGVDAAKLNDIKVGTEVKATVKTTETNGENVSTVNAYENNYVPDALEFTLHVGADSNSDNKIKVEIASMSAAGLGLLNADGKLLVNGKDSTNADAAIDTIANAIQKVSTQRSALGAVQNRLEHTINNLDNVVENTTSAESAIRDTDMATEMVKYSNNNILSQAGQAMLAQANQSNQGVLSLLQ
ncbi:MAG: hypothetical protein MSA29_01135 [Lachnospiraceae bacterium]|nr:hypothetical protein [Lachnospiraceae bacterium]